MTNFLGRICYSAVKPAFVFAVLAIVLGQIYAAIANSLGGELVGHSSSQIVWISVAAAVVLGIFGVACFFAASVLSKAVEPTDTSALQSEVQD